jgi:hypothetical protein
MDDWPDKVAGVQRALRENSHAIADGRFGDATRHGRACRHLAADLRAERERERGGR